MEKNRSKVLMSILIIALCLAVCVGLTYAYFTDSAKSSGNKIQAGNLKLDLQLYDKTDGWHSIKDSQDPVFNYDKWEPGYVDVKLLKIENLGDLAMQWEAKIVSTETISELANVIEVYVQTSNSEMPYPANRAEALAWTKVGTLDQFINTTEKLASGTFTAQGEAYYISIALYMPAEITDNTLQEKVVGEFDIQINATQLAYESDAFGPDYDTSATLPEGGVTPPDDTEDTEDTTESGDEPVEPTDPELFTWDVFDDHAVVTGFIGGNVANVVIPSTYNGLPVTAVGNWAFGSDAELSGLPYTVQSVVIPDSVTTIGEYAFYEGNNLLNVKIGNGVTTIGKDAFKGCYNLTSIEIPNSVTTIGVSAFEGCGGLTNIEIPDSVTTIGTAAFSSCTSLTSITFEGIVAQWNAISLGNSWNYNVPATEVICSDGTVALN